MASIRGDITFLLEEIRAGRDPEGAREQLIRAIYDQLRSMAGKRMRRERPGHTLQPTALVHEALIKLLHSKTLVDAHDRLDLFSAAANAMRQVLIDSARRHRARKRAGDPVPLAEALGRFKEQNLDVIALDEALEKMARRTPGRRRSSCSASLPG